MANTYIGTLCKRDHKHEGKPKSLRLFPSGHCLECHNMLNQLWANRNAEKMNKSRKNWRVNNQQQTAEYYREYKAENREKIRTKDAKRRATKKQALVIPFTDSEWLKKYRHQFQGCCAYCQQRISFAALSQDHLIPLVKGGEHSLRNLIPACKSCNCSKHDSDVFEWLRDCDHSIPGWLCLLQTEEWFIMSYYAAFKK